MFSYVIFFVFVHPGNVSTRLLIWLMKKQRNWLCTHNC